MCSTLRLGYSVMVSATDSDSVGRGSNPCTPAFFISCRFFLLRRGSSAYLYSFLFRGGFVGLWLRGVSVRDGAIKKPVRRRVIQTPKARTSAVAIIFAQYAPSK